MNELLTNLLKLQALEFGETTEKNIQPAVAELRGVIPVQILAHYDRLAVRGKKGVAVIRNQVCSGCHMKLPIGTLNVLMHGTDVRLCDTCGRYLYLPDPAESEFVEKIAATKPAPKAARKPRKPKALAATAG